MGSSFINETEWKLGERFWIQKSNNIEEGAFEKSQADKIHEHEDNSWWYKYRRSLLENIIEKYFDKDKDIIDIGGGNGFLASGLQKRGFKVNILEPSLASCQYARERGVKNIYCGMIDETSIRDNSLPQVLLCDVLEHIKDDKEFFNLIGKKLLPGGKLLVTVPAFQNLWSSEDSASGHYRRYTLEEVYELVQNSTGGLKILYANYFFGFLYFPVLMVRVIFERVGLLKRVEDRSEEEFDEVQKKQYINTNWLVGKILSVVEKREFHNIIVKEKRIRRGSSLFVVVRKQEEFVNGESQEIRND